MMRLIRKKQLGFSLVELLVVVSIIAIIAGITVANYRKGEKSKRVTIAADTVVNALRNGQNFALTSRQILTSSCNQGKAPKSYLVFFSPAQNIDLYGVDKCDEAALIESYDYPVGVQIQANGYKLNGSPVSALQFNFATPFAKTTVSQDTAVNNGVFVDFVSSDITVESEDGEFIRAVSVDGISGRIGE
jgi:prepilin-type N-terminal cleavage/methylation domain-containing protein